MREIAETPWNGLIAASTFSGGGGSSCGYRMAGYQVRYANEFIRAAQQTYRRNWKTTVLDPRDIRLVGPEDIAAATGTRIGELDLLDGSPPCSDFSTAGKRQKSWGKVKRYSDTQQRVDDLFWEFARILRGLQPRSFVAENVSGLVKGTAKGYFKAILRMLRECGYQVEARLLNAAWMGVPQSRERIIFIGIRNDLGKLPEFPKPLPYQYTVREALEGVADGEKRPIKTGTLTHLLYHNTPQGKPLAYANGILRGDDTKWHSHQRLHWARPCSTIMQAATQVYHPDEPRPLTIPELKRLCSFPDDYILTGSIKRQWERCGRSVPPVMMQHIAQAVAKTLKAQ